MRGRFVLLAAALLVSLAGCDAQTLMKKLAPAEESAVAQRYLDDVREGKFAELAVNIAPERRAEFAQVLPSLRASVPRETPKSVKIIGSQTVRTPAATVYGLTYEYEYSKSWIIAQIVLQRTGKDLKITGMHFTPLANSIEWTNRFTFSGRTGRHFFFLFAAAAILSLIVWTAIVCWRTPMLKRKWLWMIFILVGLGSVTLNWTNGAIVYQLIAFVLLGAGYHQALYGPILVQVGMPVGAILFWVRRLTWGRGDVVNQRSS